MKNRILFIGAGKVGTTLARSLFEKGYEIPMLLSKEIPDNYNEYLPNTKFDSIFNSAYFQDVKIIIITVPDDQIKAVATDLETKTIDWTGKIIMHSSGCLNSIELELLKKKGALVGSIHPMQTFGGNFLPKSIFKDIVFSVEGENEVIIFAEKMTKLLDAKLIKLNPEDKVLFHIAAVASSNFIVAILDYISELYTKLNFDDAKIKDLILPIFSNTLNNFKMEKPKNILTGPLKRGDLITIEKHIQYLNENEKEMLPMYREISKYILQFMLNQNTCEKEKLEKILDND